MSGSLPGRLIQSQDIITALTFTPASTAALAAETARAQGIEAAISAIANAATAAILAEAARAAANEATISTTAAGAVQAAGGNASNVLVTPTGGAATVLSTIAATALAAMAAVLAEVTRAQTNEVAILSVAAGAIQAAGGDASAAIVTPTGGATAKSLAYWLSPAGQSAQFVSWVNQLPTTLPGTPYQAWSDGGVPCVSQP